MSWGETPVETLGKPSAAGSEKEGNLLLLYLGKPREVFWDCRGAGKPAHRNTETQGINTQSFTLDLTEKVLSNLININ